MFQFKHIEFLALLALVPLLVAVFYYARSKKRAIIKKIGDPALVNLLTANHNKSAFLKKFLLLLLAFGILVITLANLRSPSGSEKVSRNGIDLMIALDVSKSMLAQDIKPNRLERAKQFLSRLVDKLNNHRIGIVIFAGKAYLQMPLTGDHTATKMYISAATTESVPTQGTVIADALKMCYASFNTKEKKYKAVLLISDGEDHDENAVKTAEQMAASGVVIHTVGMGSSKGAPLLDENTNDLKKDAEGNIVISRLNEEELRSIAQKGNGQYLLFNNTDAVAANISDQLNSMDQRNVMDNSLVNYKSYFQYLLAVAFLFLLVELFISERKRVKNKRSKLKPAITFLLIFAGSAGFAQDEKEVIKKGNDAYKQKDYVKASGAYTEAIQKDPENPTALYNLGNATYKSGKKEEAIKAYDNAIERLNTADEKSNAYHNKGVVLQNDQKLPECIEAYKNALKLSPGNEDARQNLQKALRQQKQEQQKKDQEKKKQEQKKDKNQQKQEPKPQPSKLTKQDADNKLKALMQQEKNLQDKLHKVNAAAVNKPEKDW